MRRFDWLGLAVRGVYTMKTGVARLTRPGPAAVANPQVIATTLSALIDDLSSELTQAIREAAKP
jgi:hypothetical protein